ncbi:MAG: dihydrodipicolinate synthase family protein, partial [Pirellulales bacterium]
PPLTPMHEDGSLHLDLIEPYAELLIRDGVRGVFVCGSTGESLSLTVAERMLIAQRWAEVAGDDLKILVQVGHNCLDDACTLAEHAGQLNVAGVAAIAPCFFRPQRVEDLVADSAKIAAAAGSTPFFFYHIPAMTGVYLPMVDFLEQAAERIPNFKGLKFTHHDLYEFHRCLVASDGRFELLWGRDELLLAAVTLGARGAVGTNYNYAAPLFLTMIDAFHRGDIDTARRHAGTITTFVAALLEQGGLRAAKSMMKLRGIDCGPTRLPVHPWGEGGEAAWYDQVASLGIIEEIEALAAARQ